MKIIEVCKKWPSETFIYRHVKALEEHDFPVIFLTRYSLQGVKTSASVTENIRGLNVNFIPNFDGLTTLRKIFALKYLLFSPKDWFKNDLSLHNRITLAYFRLRNPDIIHFHTATLAAKLNWVAKELNIPYTVSVRGSDIHVAPLKSADEMRKINEVLENASGIHANYPYNALTISKFPGGPFDVQVIYTTVPIPQTLPEYSPASSHSYHFLAVQRLHWTKDITNVLIALNKLIEQGFPADLTIVGSGPDEQRLRYWVKRLCLDSCVQFTGKLSYKEIQALLQSSHATIQAYTIGGVSNTLAEALAQGCPVFVTNSEGLEELIKDQENGILLKPFSPQSWASKLRLVENRELMEKLRLNGYKTAQKFFSSERHAQQFKLFYEQVEKNDFIYKSKNYLSKNQQELNINKIINVFITGKWKWEGGGDFVLHALAKLKDYYSIRIRLVGHGPQEEELRYLANHLGFADWTMQSEFHNDDSYDLLIKLPEAVNGFWQIEMPNRLSQIIPFGDLVNLSKVVEYLLGTA